MSGLIQAVSAGGPWIRNPQHFGKIGTGELYQSSIKSAAGTHETFSTAGAIGKIAYQGAVASLASNNTFVTVCNITGAGICTALVSGSSNGGATTSTIEVTVDGQVYTLTAALTLGDVAIRHVVGLIGIATATAGQASGPLCGNDYPIQFNMAGNSSVGSTSLIWPQTARAQGLPALRFETGLMVRMKMGIIGTAGDARTCGVMYQLDH